VRRAAVWLILLGALSQDWKRVEPGIELAYPRDHGAHPEYHTEWWYLTGNLEDENGQRFGFQFTVFRGGEDPRSAAPGDSPLRVREILAGHLVVTDVTGGQTLLAERRARGGTPLARASREDLELVLEDWTLARRSGDRLELAASDVGQGIGLDLGLEPERPLVLHGANGYSAKGDAPGMASAYASWTRLRTSGELRLGERRLRVTGEAWFDHEFGSAVLPDDVAGWDWFGLQLDGDQELMLFVLRDLDGAPTAASAATHVMPGGEVRTHPASAISLESLASWTSARTGATYPARWRITVPGLTLEVRTLVPDCELVTAASTGVTYWEGPVEVQGTSDERAVTGRGYAELTGYAHPMTARF
jgi:predicted secreted hydrolase